MRINKVVVRDNVDVGLENQNTVYLENSKMDHLAADEIYQDPSNDETYINIKKELGEDKTQGEEWAAKEDSANVTPKFADENNREIAISPDAEESAKYSVELTKVDEQGNPLAGAVFDLYEEGNEQPIREGLTTDKNGKITLDNLTSIGDYYFVETKAPEGYQLDGVKHYFKVTIASQTSKSDYVYYNLDAAELEKDRPLKISGISSDGPSIIVNVDLKGRSELNINSKIIPVIDENDRHNQETEDFADAKILFNFYNSNDTTINVNQPFSGTMLAPEAKIVAYQNVDGSLIADDVNVVGGETHRWDFQSAFQTGDGVPVELTVTNSKEETAETVKVAGNKKWIDGNNPERPKQVIVDLYQNGQQIDYREITAKDNWHYSFDNLPKYDENGDEYLYTVKEWKVPGYITGVDGDDNITNTLATSISGNKIWVDNDNAAGKRPSSIKVDLYQNGVQIDSKKVSGEGNEWPYNFANLPKYDADGKEYVYTVKEETVPVYTQTQNGLEITNTIEPEVTPEPETTAVSGTKTWIDNDDAGKTRPDSINVHLYQNGELFKSQTVTAANNWQYSFTDLPKYDENGAEYEYTIGEDAVPGYTSDREGDNLTNTLEETTTEPEKTEIKGTKTWVGDDENNRPSSITIDLYRDGQKIDSKQVTAADNWAYSFTDLDKDDGNGHEYVYSVKEADVPDDYTSEQIGTDFVNTYIAKETTEISGKKI
ncbi:MAG: Cna B-type domain-containing protein [Lactobacillaceae bacterium]|jgi:choice-of-anchor A domain-containing protein|nr:Cna B-type domain-containing protein [Lactobacillaceae bacterium]